MDWLNTARKNKDIMKRAWIIDFNWKLKSLKGDGVSSLSEMSNRNLPISGIKYPIDGRRQHKTDEFLNRAIGV